MKHTTRFIIVPLLLVVIISTGFGWGNATHTHFSKQLGVHAGHLNYNEMYGSVITDAFNMMLDEKGRYMAVQLHGNNFMLYVHNARTCGQRASAFGVASHNDEWGADYTAHHNSFTFPAEGYVIAKGTLLAPSIYSILLPLLIDAGLDEPTAMALAAGIAPEFGHDLSETAVDLLLRSLDPSIGRDMVEAATRRSSDVVQLLTDTYAADLALAVGIQPVEAKKFIMNAEREYRDQMIQYGRILTLPDDQAIGTLAYVSALAAEQYIEAIAPTIDVTIDPAVVAGMLLEAIANTAPDFAGELTQTGTYLDAELQAQGIASCESPAPVVTNALAPSLNDNFPNPFNPSTTISFTIPSLAAVNLEIYNIIGEKVRTLIKETSYDEGTWTAVWDGKNDAGIAVPSGVYISRLASPMGSSSRKMTILK